MNTSTRVESRRERLMNIGKRIQGMAAAGLLLGGLAFAGNATAAVVQVRGNVSPLVAKATFVGHHNPSAMLNINVALPLRNLGQLDQFLHDVKDRSSPSFHRFLTPAQFKALYGPTDSQVAAVAAFLKQHGITVLGPSGNNTRVYGRASTAVLEGAFGVAINDYSYNGTKFYSANSNPLVPSGLGVSAVFGLDNATQWKPHNIQNLHPTPMGAGLGPSGYGPTDIADTYDWPDITNLANGAGVHIAIATAYSFRPLDLAKFWSTYGLPPHSVANSNAVTVEPEQLHSMTLSTNVLNGETTLDTERSSSMAPGASVDVYEAVNPAFSNFDAIFQQIATDGDAVVTTSWGLAEAETGLATIGAEHTVFVEMESQGQIVMAAAGDNGAGDADKADNGGTDNADYPASDPFVIAAGGTTLPTTDPTGQSAWSGAGGADSMFFAEPDYQTNTTAWVSNTNCSEDVSSDTAYIGFPSNLTHFDITGVCTGAGNASRQSSDMALDADPATGYAIYYNGRWEVFGGTSFVAPELAGLFAILAQQEGGNIGPGPELVYCVANDTSPVASPLFTDITSGSNGFPAGAGWDHPTGWGTPDAANFIADAQANCP